MYINHSPAEKRRVLFFQFTTIHAGDCHGEDSDPKPARDVPAGERWAFTEHRSVADLIAEGLL